MRYPFKTVAMVVAGLSCGTFVRAQEAAGQDTETVLEEITVTAQFRKENVQDTPISITALSGDMLEARSQTSLADVAGQTPNLRLTTPTGSYGPSLAIFIRGVGQTDFHPAFEPGVGIYIDEVYHPNLLGTDLDLLDLDRVEILRGPQGTLAGKNSLGGAIKLFSREPTGQGGGYVDATYGSRNREELRASTDLKLSDTLFARLSGVAKQQDGYVDQLDYGCANPGSGFSAQRPVGDCTIAKLGGVGGQAFRGILRWEPVDQFDATLSADYTHEDHTVAPDILIGTASAKAGNPNNVGGTLDNRFVAGPFATYAGFYGAQMTTPFQGGGPYAALALPELGATNASNRSIYEGWGVSGNANYRFSDRLSLKSITAYRGFDTDFGVDSDDSPLSVATGINVLHNHSFSQELRLSGDLGSQIDWTLGGYYFHQRTEYASVQDQRNSILPLVLASDDPVVSSSKAGFLNVGWKPTEALTVNLGGRYTKESKDYTFVRVNKDTGLPDTSPTGPAYLVAALNGAQSHYEGNKTDYRVAVDYRWTPELMTYASVATGFKGGGINPRPFDDLQARSFDPETLTAYEVGAKTDLFERRLRVNVSAFFNKYKDIVSSLSSCPQFSRPGTVACSVLINGGDGEFRGVELETTFAPVHGLTFDGSFSYLDFKYTSIDPSVGGAAHPLGPQLDTPAASPKYRASLGVQYEIGLPTGGSLTPRIDIVSQDRQFYARDPFTFQPEYLGGRTVANARLTWRNADADLETALEVTNLTDKYYYNSVQDFRNNYGAMVADVARPREWAVSVKKHF